jgi:hypothetical protein
LQSHTRITLSNNDDDDDDDDDDDNNNNNNNAIPKYGKIRLTCMISGCRRDAGEIYALLRILRSVSWQVTTFRHNLSVPSIKDQVVKEGFLDFMTLEDGADGLSQKNVGHKLPTYAA